MFKYLYLL